MRVAAYSPYGINFKEEADTRDADGDNPDRISQDLDLLDIGLQSKKGNNYDTIRRSSTRRLSWCVTVGNLGEDEGTNKDDVLNPTVIAQNAKDIHSNANAASASPHKGRSKRSLVAAVDSLNASPAEELNAKVSRRKSSDSKDSSPVKSRTKRSLSDAANVLAHLDPDVESNKNQNDEPISKPTKSRKRAAGTAGNSLLNLFQ